MRGATECAKRVKSLFSSLRAKLGKVGHPPLADAVTQLVLGVLSRDVPEAKAAEGLERLRSMVVDYNELRVIPPLELAAVLGDFPDARLKCEDITRALNAIFAREHTTALDRLADLPRRDAADYLERIDGLDPYSRARIRLLGLRHHAIPLDEAMWALARRDHLVDPRCPLAEAQAFLERQISEDSALEFYVLLKRHAWSEFGQAVKRREVERILSVPPDRTARNMLAAVTASLASEAEDEPELEPPVLAGSAAAGARLVGPRSSDSEWDADNPEPPDAEPAPAARTPAGRRSEPEARAAGEKPEAPKPARARKGAARSKRDKAERDQKAPARAPRGKPSRDRKPAPQAARSKSRRVRKRAARGQAQAEARR